MQIPHILFPLYFYPLPSAWQPLYFALSSYPSVPFNIIINPNSGPGNTEYPDSSFISGIAQLNSYPNANLLGYVHTTTATRNITDVKNEIKQYANWATYTGADIAMGGIFFDEAPAEYSGAAYEYMGSVEEYARGLRLPTIIFNPGVIPATQYFTLANYIVVFEDYASKFSNSSLSSIPSQYLSQSVVIVHDLPNNTTTLSTVVDEIINARAGGLDVTTVEYDGFSALWTQFVELVANS